MIWEDNSLPIITLKITEGNPEVVFTPLQTLMFDHIQYFEYFWWTVWITTLCVLFWRAVMKKQF